VSSAGAAIRVLNIIGKWIEERPKTVLGLVFAPCALFSVATSIVQPLVVDEQYTYYVSQTGGWRQIWAALLARADNHPPLDYWLRHLAMSAFGPGQLAFRFLSLVAFCAAAFCVYLFVRKRVGAIYGVIAVLTMFSTPAYDLTFEGRYPSMLLLFGALALMSWSTATKGSRAGVVCLAISLTAAIYTDYNSVLLFAPIALGEAARTIETRRLDLRVWAALAAAGFSLAGLIPMIAAAREFIQPRFAPAGLLNALDIYKTLLERTGPVVVGLIVIAPFIPRYAATGGSEKDQAIPKHYFAVATGFLLLPIFCWVLARLVTGALHWRYILAAVIGAAILGAYAVRRLSLAFPLAPVALAVLLYFNALGCELGAFVQRYHHRGDAAAGDLPELLSKDPMPAVMGYTDKTFQILYYSEELRRRMVYLVDVPLARKWVGIDSAERGLAGLGKLAPVPVIPYREFLKSHDRFWLVLAIEPQHWLISQLLEDGATLLVRGEYLEEPVFEVRSPRYVSAR
jgi:hypothetical protein